MSRNQWYMLGVFGILLLVVLCVGVGAAISIVRRNAAQQEAALLPPTPTIPIVTFPATWTPVPKPVPTDIPEYRPRPSPTRVPAQPAAPIMPGPIDKAFEQARNVKVYRIEFDMSAKGDLGLPASPGPNQELSLLNLKGEVNGAESHLNMRGFFSMFMGTDFKQGLEMMSAGGKTYLRGPIAILGAMEDKWYVLVGDGSEAPVEPSDFVDGFGGRNGDWTGFKKGTNEMLDARRCDIYSGDRAATLKLLQSFDSSEMPSSSSLSQMTQAETRLWICDDGYFHQMSIQLSGANLDAPATNQNVSFSILLHLYDVNGNIKIVAPPNPAPLQFQFRAAPTRTPSTDWRTPVRY